MHQSQPATLLVGQSGGATAVINASLAGIVASAQKSDRWQRILGLSNGIEGLFTQRFFDLSACPPDKLQILAGTPSAALGTGRFKLKDEDLARTVLTMQSLGVTAFVYIGGNDSADTAHRIGKFAHDIGYDLQVMSVPKTIDNDLPDTDFCPGYPSIARFLGTAMRDAAFDTLASPQIYPVKFMEVMGRDAGWVAAACTAGFRDDEQDMLPLLLLPERAPASTRAALESIQRDIDRRGYSVVVVPETMSAADGSHFGGSEPEYVDPFGHPYYASTGAALTRMVQQELGLRARYEKPGTSARMSISLASRVDLTMAWKLGAAAVESITRGESGKMTALRRVPGDDLNFEITLVPQTNIANRVRHLDKEFIGADGMSVTQAFHDYLQPLLGDNPFPTYTRLDAPKTITGSDLLSVPQPDSAGKVHLLDQFHLTTEVGITVGDGEDGFGVDARGDEFVILVGQDVIGSCGNKIGEVVDVQSEYIVVEKGFFNPEDMYIPKVAIDTIDEHHLRLNVSRDASSHAGWDEEPDAADDDDSVN